MQRVLYESYIFKQWALYKCVTNRFDLIAVFKVLLRKIIEIRVVTESRIDKNFSSN